MLSFLPSNRIQESFFHLLENLKVYNILNLSVKAIISAFMLCIGMTANSQVPDAPTNFTVTQGVSRVLATFTAPGGTITNYEYSTDNGNNWISASNTTTVRGWR